MSSLGNLITDIGAAAGDEGEYSVVSLVKNPQLQSRLDTSLGDYDRTKTASSKALDQYIKEFLAGSKTATARSGQEQQAIDRYYNGEVERRLADLRARRQQAGQQAVDRSLAYLTRRQSADRVGGGGGASSYDRRIALGAGADINLQALLDNLAQERGDMDYLNRSQLAMAGQRTALADALAARGMIPSQAMKGELGWNLGTLGNLLTLDQANKFYGTRYEPSATEHAGNITGDVAQLVMDYYTGGASSMLGGGGGRRQTPSVSFQSGNMGAGGWNMDQWGTPLTASYPMGYNYEAAPYDTSQWGYPNFAFGPGY